MLADLQAHGQLGSMSATKQSRLHGAFDDIAAIIVNSLSVAGRLSQVEDRMAEVSGFVAVTLGELSGDRRLQVIRARGHGDRVLQHLGLSMCRREPDCPGTFVRPG
ncbi:MAG: hypothetical protein AAF367_05650 [Pseudomonadota bacterium]